MKLSSLRLADLEQSAIQTLEARFGALPDDELIIGIIAEKLLPLSKEDLIKIAKSSPNSFLSPKPKAGEDVDIASIIRRECAEYLALTLYLKIEAIKESQQP